MVSAAVLMLAALALLTLAAGPTSAQQPPGGGPPSGGGQAPGQTPSSPPASTPTSAAGQGGDQSAETPEMSESASRAAVALAREMAIVAALGGFTEAVPTELATAFDELGLAEGDQAELLEQLHQAEDEAVAELAFLTSQGVVIGPDRQAALEPLSDADLAALESGQPISIEMRTYNALLEDLLQRNGRPSLETGHVPDPAVMATTLELLLAPETPGGDAATADDTTPDADSDADGTDGSTEDDGSSLPLILALVAIALAAVGAVLAYLRYRRPTPSESDFDDLLDISRRLAAAVDPRDVERIAVGEAVRLSHASAGALVHRSANAFVAGYGSQPGMRVGGRLGDGVLGRVAETASAVNQVSNSEPALRNLPVSLAAVPVVASSRVAAVLLVVRSDDRPYGPSELDLLRSLAPVVAAALESARYADEAEERSLADGLTGVGNRLRLERELPSLVASTDSPTAVIMVDLDHFKSVNDTHGHQAGDDLLRAVAELVQANVRPRDTVYRYGGEEFCVVLPGADATEAARVAERVRAAIAGSATSVGPENVMLSATASFGVASVTGGDSETLVARADEALYEAKESGRNRVVTAP